MKNNREWKDKNIEYITQLQKFLDVTDNIKDETLKNRIIIEMLKCDEILTKICEDRMKE